MSRPKIHVCHFSYGGICQANAVSMLRLVSGGEGNIVYRATGGALIDLQRSQAATIFLQGDCDVFVMIDHDMGFDPETILGLADRAHACKGIVGAVYARREFGGGVNTVLKNPPGKIGKIGQDVLEDCISIGTGVMAVSRAALEQMIKTLADVEDPTLKIVQAGFGKHTPKFYTFFLNTVIKSPEGYTFMGEDVSFCRRALAAGVPVKAWLKPQGEHYGEYGFTLQDSVRKNPEPRVELKSERKADRKDRWCVLVIAQFGDKHYEALREVAEAVQQAIAELGYHSQLRFAHEQEEFPDDFQYIVFGSHSVAEPQCFLPGAIFYNTEKWSSKCVTPKLRQAYVDHETWDYSQINADKLGTIYVPLGYASRMTRIKNAEKKDIDVLFYGSNTDRRRLLLDEIRSRGLVVEETEFGVYASARDEVIARSKIVLNMHLERPDEPFEHVRVQYLLANKACVVSERSPDSKEYESGVFFADYAKIPELCERVARDPVAREATAAAGFEYIKSRKMADILRPLIGEKK